MKFRRRIDGNRVSKQVCGRDIPLVKKATVSVDGELRTLNQDSTIQRIKFNETTTSSLTFTLRSADVEDGLYGDIMCCHLLLSDGIDRVTYGLFHRISLCDRT